MKNFLIGLLYVVLAFSPLLIFDKFKKTEFYQTEIAGSELCDHKTYCYKIHTVEINGKHYHKGYEDRMFKFILFITWLYGLIYLSIYCINKYRLL